MFGRCIRPHRRFDTRYDLDSRSTNLQLQDHCQVITAAAAFNENSTVVALGAELL